MILTLTHTPVPVFNILRLALILAAIAFGFLAHAAEEPNVIVIMADDLGYGDVSCYGATAFKTPHIDRLAAEGLRFTSGYVSASTCTPTRDSFLTRSYAFRRAGTGIAPPNGKLKSRLTALIAAGRSR